MTSADQDEHDEEPRGGLVRRVLGSGPSPEERLEQLLAQRRRELEEHAVRLRESIAELEHREELLRDSRASVERMLRMGTSDLEAREAELTDFLSSLTERESALSEAEADLARRRQDLGRRRAETGRGRAPRACGRGAGERARRARGASGLLVPRADRSEPETVELALRPGRALPARRDRRDGAHALGSSSTSRTSTTRWPVSVARRSRATYAAAPISSAVAATSPASAGSS